MEQYHHFLSIIGDKGNPDSAANSYARKKLSNFTETDSFKELCESEGNLQLRNKESANIQIVVIQT